MLHMRMIQSNVFQIGTSVGLVLELNCDTKKEADVLREVLQTVVEAEVKARGYAEPRPDGGDLVDMEDLYEVISKAVQNFIRAE